MNFTPIFLMASGIVAENKRVWRSAGVALMINSRSSMKPMFNISSASSRINVSMSPSCKARRLIKSTIRPGVPTTTCAPDLSALICLSMLAPPKTERTLMPLSRPKRKSSSCDCTANSRVGAITIACKPPLTSILFKVGRPKAAVLPVPVWA